MLRRFLLAALLVPALMVSSAFAAEKITVASDPTWPPMEFLDDNKQVVGDDVDTITAVAAGAGMEARSSSCPRARLPLPSKSSRARPWAARSAPPASSLPRSAA